MSPQKHAPEPADSKPNGKPDVSNPDFSVELAEKNKTLWWVSFLGPWLAGLIILAAVFLINGSAGLTNLGIAAAATFLMLGRFVILFGGEEPITVTEEIAFHMSSESLFVMLTIMDFLVAFFVAFHMDVLFRMPILGRKLAEMVSDGRFILKHQPWIRNIAFAGLVLFVIFPSSTTGSIGGSIFGRLLGMKRVRVVSAILIGSLMGNGLMYILAGWISQYISNDNLWLKLGGVLGMIVVLFISERYYRSLKTKYLQLEMSQKNPDDPAGKPTPPSENASISSS
ncbi:MAG: small multi-drug export protein [Planctomycetota bacterium]|nr:small multi-drug export protein [Planctomycetota bacterium]